MEKALLYLSSCAVNSIPADPAVVSQMDVDQILKLAAFHQLSSLVASALEASGLKDPGISREQAIALRRTLIMDAEKDAILAEFEKAGIWYMPLKGSILKDYYPRIEMRQMSDIDILIDPDRAEDVHEIMTSLGFRSTIYDAGHRDDYQKPPVSHFEMHRVLFHEGQDKLFSQYYSNVKERLLKDEENSFGFHFSHEDFYLYMIAHEYKHFKKGGTGLRSLIDTYVFLRRFDGLLNWSWIRGEARKLKLEEFEKNNRNLALKLFSVPGAITLTEDEKKLLSYYFFSGAYGTKVHEVQNGVSRIGRIRYAMKRAILPMRVVKERYPFFFRHKILLFALPFYRMILHWKRAKKEVSYLLRK